MEHYDRLLNLARLEEKSLIPHTSFDRRVTNEYGDSEVVNDYMDLDDSFERLLTSKGDRTNEISAVMSQLRSDVTVLDATVVGKVLLEIVHLHDRSDGFSTNMIQAIQNFARLGYPIRVYDVVYVLTYAGANSEQCKRHLEVIEILQKAGIKLPDLVEEYKMTLIELVAETESVFEKLRHLPTIPPSLLQKSERIYQHMFAWKNFDIHREFLDMMHGKSVLDHAINKRRIDWIQNLRWMEDIFTRETPLTKTAYVFRGLRVRTIDEVKLSTETITFAAWDPQVAFSSLYFSNVLLVIELPPGTPVIRTAIEEEIILPPNSILEIVGDPTPMPTVVCTRPDTSWMMHVRCLPTARLRMTRIPPL